MIPPSEGNYSPTSEQQVVLDWLHDARDEDAFVVARAGSGKTTLLLQCAHALKGQKAAFVAFNRSIAAELSQKISELYGVDEGQELPAHATTLHGLGFRALRRMVSGAYTVDPDKYVRKARYYTLLSVENTKNDESLANGRETTLTRVGRAFVGRALALARAWQLVVDSDDDEASPLNYDTLFNHLCSCVPVSETDESDDTDSLTGDGLFLIQCVEHIAKFVRLGMLETQDLEALQKCLQQHPFETSFGRRPRPQELCLATAVAVHIVRGTLKQALSRKHTLLAQAGAISAFRIDFVDMLWLPVKLMPSAPLAEHEKYPWIFVDEAQDLSRVGAEVLRMFRATRRAEVVAGRIVAVGDPNQAIYGFAGADTDAVRYMISPRSNSGRQTEVLSLSTCFRCPSAHLAMARRLVPDISARKDATEGVVQRFRMPEAASSIAPQDLVLARSNKWLAEFKEVRETLERGEASLPVIPMRFNSSSDLLYPAIEAQIRNIFLDAGDDVKLAFSQIREAAEDNVDIWETEMERDSADLEIIGDIVLNDIDSLRTQAKHVWKVILPPKSRTDEIPLPTEDVRERYREAQKRLKNLISRCRRLMRAIRRESARPSAQLGPLPDFPKRVTTIEARIRKARAIPYARHSLRSHDMRVAEKLIEILSWMSKLTSLRTVGPNVEDAVFQIHAALEQFERELRGNSVLLSTIHRAKGLQASRVVILGFDELPAIRAGHTREQALQEWNVTYVAVTRSSHMLTLVMDGEADVMQAWQNVSIPLEHYRSVGRGLDVVHGD